MVEYGYAHLIGLGAIIFVFFWLMGKMMEKETSHNIGCKNVKEVEDES